MIKTTHIHVNPIKLDKLVHLQSLLHAILSYAMSGHVIDCLVLVTAQHDQQHIQCIFTAYQYDR